MFDDHEKTIEIRPETLRPADRWVQPTKEEVRELIRLTGMTGGFRVPSEPYVPTLEHRARR